MLRPSLLAFVVIVLPTAAIRAQDSTPVTFRSLLRDLDDLGRLTRWPDPEYTTVQWSSTDRRSVAPDQPGWFANADGFGGEPQPGFAAVLQAPGADGIGEYLVGDVDGPGAIVRGWSAGMKGQLRVVLDDVATPLFEGAGYDFFARRSQTLLAGFAQLPENVRRLLQQEDADYLPIPFAQHLRVTWRGRLDELHFYQLQLRRYASGTAVETFANAPDLAAAVPTAIDPWANMTIDGGLGSDPIRGSANVTLTPGTEWHTEIPCAGGGELRWLRFVLDRAPPDAWRSVLLRVAFDGAAVPQIEVPLGDFSGAGPWLPPLQSAAFRCESGLECRWPMPFARQCRLELHNFGDEPVAVIAHWRGERRAFDDRSLYFHALWRIDRELAAQGGAAPIDLPYVHVAGRGRFVGVGCQITNPPMRPEWRSNWWGEGDEKIAVDGAWAAIGTGSEDYFNYSWSHWRRFDLPFCGQPLATGPGNCGFASNQRLQIVDDLPFAQSLDVALELWTHKPVAPLGYGRTVWFYARPGARTDHRAVQPSDLAPPTLPPWRDADLAPRADMCMQPAAALLAGREVPGRTATVPTRLLRTGSYLRWTAKKGGELPLPFTLPGDGQYRLRLCMQQRVRAPTVQVLLDGAVLRRGNDDVFALACERGERFEDLVFEQLELAAGAHALALRCADGGEVGIDLVGWERTGKPVRHLDGAVEAEDWPIVRRTDGLAVDVQQLGGDWSGGRHRWIKAQQPGDQVAFTLTAPTPGRYRVTLRLTTSWDYGIVRVDWNGARAADDVDLWCGPDRRIGAREIDLGERDLAAPAELTFTVAGHAAGNEAPHCYFGIDCALLRR